MIIPFNKQHVTFMMNMLMFASKAKNKCITLFIILFYISYRNISDSANYVMPVSAQDRPSQHHTHADFHTHILRNLNVKCSEVVFLLDSGDKKNFKKAFEFHHSNDTRQKNNKY